MTDTRVKSCPSCQTPFQRGDQVVVCPQCGMMYHYACWQQDGGCRQAGCVAATHPATMTSAPLAPVVDAVPPSTDLRATTPPADEMLHVPDAETIPPPPPADPVLERLLSEAHQRFRQGVVAGTEQLLAEAKKISPEHPGVLELEGDLAREKGHFAMAERLYRQAFHADRGNARLEEKFATALLKMHEPELSTLPDDSPWSDRVPRIPVASGIMSVLLPGLGQFHNGDYLKGAILAVSWAMLLMSECSGIFWDAILQLRHSGPSISPAYYITHLFHGGNTLLTLLALAVWLYSIIDAVLVAKNPG